MPELCSAIYARVSTKTQAEDGSSLKSQQLSCQKLAEQRGLLVRAEDIFLEDWPGDTLDRPKLRQLREGIRHGRYQAILCHATDRLARNPIHLAILAEECEKHSVQLFFRDRAAG